VIRFRAFERLVLWLYGLLTTLLIPILRRKLHRRAAQEPLYGYATQERFGMYSQPADQGRLWIHAVSLGETRAAAILLAEMRRIEPELRLLLTHGTATGREEGKKLLRDGDVQVWQPWDCPCATRRFIDHFRPSLGIILETEIWPSLCATTHAQHIPLALVNARLSERSWKKMRMLPSLMRPALERFAMILAQTTADAQRFQDISGKLPKVMGNLKFDAQVDEQQVQKGRQFRLTTPKSVMTLASSRDGEEEQLLHAIRKNSLLHQEAQSGAQPIQWLIVPRHPQRFDQVRRLCESMGFSVSPRSSWQSTLPPADILLGDSMGEMPMYYALSDVALLGGSFKEYGGQNLIESLACACPIILGQHTYNFEQACSEAIQVGAALRVNDLNEAVSLAYKLVEDQGQKHAMQQAAHSWLSASRGAAIQTALALQSITRSDQKTAV
jgi:3-deoxy-D-manno-octulosonic-acid transferase